jgi:hypothetical protein
MKKIMIGAFVALGFSMTAACGGGLGAKMTAFADKACACKDLDCLQGVQKEMTDFAMANKEAKGTESDMKAAQAAMTKIAECAGKLAAGAAAGE